MTMLAALKDEGKCLSKIGYVIDNAKGGKVLEAEDFQP